MLFCCCFWKFPPLITLNTMCFFSLVSVEILSFNVSQKSDLEGSPVTLIAEITDVYTYSVQWFRNEIMVTNASTRYKISSFPTANGTTKHILNITKIYKRDQGNFFKVLGVIHGVLYIFVC